MNLLGNLTSIAKGTQIVSAHYAEGVNDLRGEFSRVLSKVNPAISAVRREFMHTGIKLLDKRLSAYKASLEETTFSVMREALLAANVDPDEFLKHYGKPLVAYLKELVYVTTFGVSGIARKDVKYGSDQLKAISFNVMATMADAGLRNAVKGAVVRNIVANANYTGRNGKEWRSVTNVSLATRWHLLTVFNETMLFVGTQLGDKEFVIRTYSPNNQFANKRITLADYADIKSAAFHPNSNALIYRVKRPA